MGCCEDAGNDVTPSKYVTDIAREGCALVVSYSDGTSVTISLKCDAGSDGDPGEVPQPTGTNKCAVAQSVSDQVINQWADIVGQIVPLTSEAAVAAVVALFVADNHWPVGAFPPLLAWAVAGWLSSLHNNALGNYNIGESAYRDAVKQAIHCCLADDADFNATVRNCARSAFYDPLDVWYTSFQTFWLFFPLEIARTWALAASNIDPNDVFCDPCSAGAECTAFTRLWTAENPWENNDVGWAFVASDASNFTLDWWQGFWSSSGQPNTEFAHSITNGQPASQYCVSNATCKNLGIIYEFPDPCTVTMLDSRSEHVGNNTVGRAWFVRQNGVWVRIKTYNRPINGQPIPGQFEYVAGVDGAPLYNVEAVALILPQGGGYWYVSRFAVNADIV